MTGQSGAPDQETRGDRIFMGPRQKNMETINDMTAISVSCSGATALYQYFKKINTEQVD